MDLRLKIRPMRLSDLDEVMEIDQLCLPVSWTENIWKSELQSPLGLHLVAENLGDEILVAENPGLSGQIGVKRVLDELHVTTLAVRPEARRSGVARALLEAAVEESPEARFVYLEVRPSNEAGLTFYYSLGFQKTGTRPRYYGDEDAVLMTLNLRDR